MVFDRTSYMRKYRKIVQCHGHFDLLHYGHLKHLEAAAQLGRLYVTLTAGRHMVKPGHPIFTDEQRLEMVRALRFVWKAAIVDSPDAESAIKLVHPDIYVKGREYDGRLAEKKFCEERGIKVVFLGEKLFGSTNLKSSLFPTAS